VVAKLVTTLLEVSGSIVPFNAIESWDALSYLRRSLFFFFFFPFFTDFMIVSKSFRMVSS